LLFQYVRRPSTIRRTLQQVYVDKSAITEQLVADIRRPALAPGAARVFASVFKSRQGEKVDELLQKLTCPLLMLWGEGDPWMNCREKGAKFRQYYPTLNGALPECWPLPPRRSPRPGEWVTQRLGNRAHLNRRFNNPMPP
jgi:pimeloyl-ACP methyl ester carboxylesterase